MKKKNLIVIAGPTGIGKTSIGIRLAKYFKSEILSADSRQIYKEMEIGTARPDKTELSQVKHHLVEIGRAHVRTPVTDQSRMPSSA